MIVQKRNEVVVSFVIMNFAKKKKETARTGVCPSWLRIQIQMRQNCTNAKSFGIIFGNYIQDGTRKKHRVTGSIITEFFEIHTRKGQNL
jgi:hypothetical protein